MGELRDTMLEATPNAAQRRGRRLRVSPVHSGRGIPLAMTGPSQSAGVLARRALALLSWLAITLLAAFVLSAGAGTKWGN